MRTLDRSATARKGLAGPVLLGPVLLLAGCAGQSARNGWEPDVAEGATNHTGRIMALWNGSWLTLMIVGVITWGLMLWCVVAYRRRRSDTGLPVQLRYNNPIEIFYTVIPLMMVGVLFFYTARDESAVLSRVDNPDHVVSVVGKQWSWNFNYVPEGVYVAGRQADLDGKPGTMDRLPTLVLPVDESVEFVLTSGDVNHSFWIPAFLMKMDNIAGRVNRFQLTPTKVGTYKGKCAELCGQYHSEMLFNVRVVPRTEFDTFVQTLKARGQTGQLCTDLGRSQLEPGADDTCKETSDGQ